MVTRNINANTATQVNANLIGVQVRPEVVPPTYEVRELTANVRVHKYLSETEQNGKPMLYMYNEIWGYTGSDEEYGGMTYNVWNCIMGNNTDTYYTDSNVDITDDTEFYVYDDNPDNPPMKSIGNSQYKLSYSGYLYEFDPNNGILCDLDSKDTYALVNGFIMNNNTGSYAGKIVSDSLDNEEYTGVYYGEDGEYTVWHIEVSDGIDLFSSTRNPAVGDNLRSNTYSETVYLSPVLTVTEDEVDPGYTEDIDCKVEYSVDGETWTEWPDHMTDDNNVISNIPRYMYLKFSQDVVITEE